MQDASHHDELISEREILENLIQQNLIETRRSRRWAIFFKFIFLLLFLFFIFLMLGGNRLGRQAMLHPHTSLIDITGLIDQASIANADDVASSINAAFNDKYSSGIILRINSPGGSPVQASYIYNEIRRLQSKHKNVKVYAVCVDVCASAAYYIASAADSIYANPASIVGSIGVLMEGFGFPAAMQKLGIQRRLIISGDHKAFLDPFSPLKPDDQKIAQGMINDVHQQFIHDVEMGRGNRLKKSPSLYSGLAWTGKQSLSLGLIDGFGSAGYVAREIIKNDRIIDYTVKPSYFEQVANKVGITFANVVLTEARGRLR